MFLPRHKLDFCKREDGVENAGNEQKSRNIGSKDGKSVAGFSLLL